MTRLNDNAGFGHTIGSPWATAIQLGHHLQVFTPELAAKALEQLEQRTSGMVQPRLEVRGS